MTKRDEARLQGVKVPLVCGGCGQIYDLYQCDSYKNTFSCPLCGHTVNDDPDEVKFGEPFTPKGRRRG